MHDFVYVEAINCIEERTTRNTLLTLFRAVGCACHSGLLSRLNMMVRMVEICNLYN